MWMESGRYGPPFVHTGVAIVGERRTDELIAQYSSTRRLLQKHFEDNSSRIWFAIRRALLDVYLGWTARLLDLDGTYGDKL